MRTYTQSFAAFCIIILTLTSFMIAARPIRADDDPSDSDSDVQTPAQMFYPTLETLTDNASLSLTASAQNDSVSWSYEPMASTSPTVLGLWNGGPYPFSEVLSTAVLTLDLYKGVMGSSTLMHSETLASSTSGSFPFAFDQNSTYYLALSATYPDGTYPPGQSPADRCPGTSGDFCPIRSYPLGDFQNALMNGYDIAETTGRFNSYMPAAYGFLNLSISQAPAKQVASNVLFIPGTLTSRLYMKNPDGSERDLWEPHSDLDVGPLAMDASGKSLNTIYTRDIVDQLYSNDSVYGMAVKKALGTSSQVYGPFELFMNGLVSSGTITAWRAYPYDWRYDVSDIVKNGTLVGTATATPSRVYLQDIVQQLASTSPTGKVTIIAHSNGGLIAKALAIDLQSKGELGLIDHIIMVGTPQFGTPKSLLDMLHGSEFTQLGGLLMYSNSVRAAEETMPGPYDLLPSLAYFSQVHTAVATFDSNQPAALYQKQFGTFIDSFSKLADFVEDTFHIDIKVGLPGSTRTPIALSKALVQKAQATHASIDAWTAPSGLSVTAIAGWGQLTPYQIAYSGTNGLNCDRTSFFVPVACSLQPQLQNSVLSTDNGDDTVVAGSASGIATDALYFNAKQYESDTKNKIVHGSLLNSTPIQTQLFDLLQTNPKEEPYVSKTMPSDTGNTFTVVSAHSPVNLLATDPDGDQTGIITIGGLSGISFEKQDIPGSSIQVVDDEKYLYLPENVPYSISMQGYDSGATTVNVGMMDASGVSTTTATFADIPTTASTTATFTVGAQATAPASIDVDVDGSGATTTIDAQGAAEATTTTDTYRSSLFTLRALFASHHLPAALRELLGKTFNDFGTQKSPNVLAYLTFQALISAKAGVKLLFPACESVSRAISRTYHI